MRHDQTPFFFLDFIGVLGKKLFKKNKIYIFKIKKI
jgi:hypothetical protein